MMGESTERVSEPAPARVQAANNLEFGGVGYEWLESPNTAYREWRITTDFGLKLRCSFSTVSVLSPCCGELLTYPSACARCGEKVPLVVLSRMAEHLVEANAVVNEKLFTDWCLKASSCPPDPLTLVLEASQLLASLEAFFAWAREERCRL